MGCGGKYKSNPCVIKMVQLAKIFYVDVWKQNFKKNFKKF